MNGKAKSNSVITVEVSPDNQRIVFKILGAGELVLELANLSDQVKIRALVHGLVQRVSDAAAIPRSTETGKSATPGEKMEAMKALVEHYNSGSSEWRLARVAGASEGRSYLLNALCELFPSKARAELGEGLKKLSAVERKALEMDARVKPLIEKQQAAGLRGIDTDSLIDELRG